MGYKVNRFIKEKVLRPLPDKLFLQIPYTLHFKRPISFKSPRTFNEKIQWLKINDRKPIYTKLVDKGAVKEYIAEKLGKKYIIKTLGIYDSFDEIDFDKLPNRFVMKTTHDSGNSIIVKNKAKLDMAAARKKMGKALKRNYYYYGREWPYKNVKPRIIIEECLDDGNKTGLLDYKVFVFNGEAKLVQVDFDRQTNHSRNIYSGDWELLDLMIGYKTNHERAVRKPKQLKRMLSLSEKIAKDIEAPFVRVDFYIVNEKLYFGEITFYHGAGLEEIRPERYAEVLGGWIDLGEGEKG